MSDKKTDRNIQEFFSPITTTSADADHTEKTKRVRGRAKNALKTTGNNYATIPSTSIFKSFLNDLIGRIESETDSGLTGPPVEMQKGDQDQT